MSSKDLLNTANWYKSERTKLTNIFLTSSAAIVGWVGFSRSPNPMTPWAAGGLVGIVFVFLTFIICEICDHFVSEWLLLRDLRRLLQSEQREMEKPQSLTRIGDSPSPARFGTTLEALRSNPFALILLVLGFSADVCLSGLLAWSLGLFS